LKRLVKHGDGLLLKLVEPQHKTDHPSESNATAYVFETAGVLLFVLSSGHQGTGPERVSPSSRRFAAQFTCMGQS
jgi:hypothetical protein